MCDHAKYHREGARTYTDPQKLRGAWYFPQVASSARRVHRVVGKKGSGRGNEGHGDAWDLTGP